MWDWVNSQARIDILNRLLMLKVMQSLSPTEAYTDSDVQAMLTGMSGDPTGTLVSYGYAVSNSAGSVTLTQNGKVFVAFFKKNYPNVSLPSISSTVAPAPDPVPVFVPPPPNTAPTPSPVPPPTPSPGPSPSPTPSPTPASRATRRATLPTQDLRRFPRR